MLLKILLLYFPAFIKKKKIRELFALTADAFLTETPDLSGLSYAELLDKYAVFSKEQAEYYLESGQDPEALHSRLYHNALKMGEGIKKSLRISTFAEARNALRLIYSLLAIDFRCDSRGHILIKQCFFSRFYSDKVCRIISALDEGLAAGLSGGKLRFERRITDGNDCCKAYLETREDQ